ncbi:hypothetical protein E5161_17330 [Cohnella pontilimi]|uniref:Uncharacterized protein n=1 Tax=Cohnella pontilimi TaxID=2564100 RepID=A0A4U0F553_9BACL|nr:hypothetical protein [Cohnella pontilimi]TJY39713.1 hypothetical protein E5161_17330 [Cohnella pontilimi]
MSQDVLTKEEVEGLLSSVPASSEPSRIPSLPPAERIDDYSEITERYWQQTVIQMQRELAELQQRVETLEKALKVKKQAKTASKNKTPAAIQQGTSGMPAGGEDGKPQPIPSRKEKFKSGRKWF